MPQKPHQLMTRMQYIEALVGEALAFNRGVGKTRKVRAALLVSALRELQQGEREVAEISQDRRE